jgi:amino acid transporter
MKFVCFTAMTSLARTVFAFSRDRLIPFSKTWTTINSLTGIPLNAVWISVFFCIAINLIGLGSYAAISGVFNVTAIALDWSYCIPILCKIMFGKFTPGPWNLGRASIFINIWACTWTLFVSIIFILPTIRPTTALNVSTSSLKSFTPSKSHPQTPARTLILTFIDELRRCILGLDLYCILCLLVCRRPQILHWAHRGGTDGVPFRDR